MDYPPPAARLAQTFEACRRLRSLFLGMEKKMETILLGYIGTNIRYKDPFLQSWLTEGFCVQDLGDLVSTCRIQRSGLWDLEAWISWMWGSWIWGSGIQVRLRGIEGYDLWLLVFPILYYTLLCYAILYDTI